MAEQKASASVRRLRMQLRVVQTVFRAEMKRLEGIGISAKRQDKVRELRSRSMAILDAVRAGLDGSATWHADLSALVRELEEELNNAEESDGRF